VHHVQDREVVVRFAEPGIHVNGRLPFPFGVVKASVAEIGAAQRE
jgi:hypothetical protein